MSAVGLTYLQIVNRVLSRMRESTVAANGETLYSTFIGTLVNQVKTEIEAAYYWRALRQIITVTTVAGTTSYTLTGAGPEAAIIDAWNTSVNMRVLRGTDRQFNEWFYGASAVQTGDTTHFLPRTLDATSSYDRKIDIFPTPESAQTLKFEVFIAQADLSADATVALIPQSLLIEEVIARAKVERGEEDAPQLQPGTTFIHSELLATAVSRESGQDDREMDWDAE